VAHLAALRCEVWGIDRHVGPSDRTIQRNWFDPPLRPDGWATIVAHQSFSLHFLQAELAGREDAERYARNYMAILRGLRPGGSFLYAPGLAFIESLLPRDRYQVSTRTVAVPRRPSSHAMDLTATRVTRLT
jgi:hypothetical protein